MRYVYLDTSALVKAYVPEAGTDRIRDVLRSARAAEPTARVLVCLLAYPEAISALTRRENANELPAASADFLARRIQRDFASDHPAYNLVDATRPIVERAAGLVRRHGLRGFDAVHLAAALEVAPALGVDDVLLFACADRRLARAAVAEGLRLLDL